MRLKTWVEFSDEVEVDIGRDEILAAFSESPEPGETWLHVLNRFAFALNTLPEAVITSWNAQQRAMVHVFLTKHAARFEEPTV